MPSVEETGQLFRHLRRALLIGVVVITLDFESSPWVRTPDRAHPFVEGPLCFYSYCERLCGWRWARLLLGSKQRVIARGGVISRKHRHGVGVF